MESLALLAAIILGIAVIGGPMSLLLSFIPSKPARVSTVIFAGLAVIDSVHMLSVRVASGAKIMALLGLVTAGTALWRIFRPRKPNPYAPTP
jgi:hypothetical protein